MSIVKTINSPHWQNITFQVCPHAAPFATFSQTNPRQIFDIPSSGDLPFEERLDLLNTLFGPNGKYACAELVVVHHEQARDREHVLEKLKEVETLGGEGIMLRKPESYVLALRLHCQPELTEMGRTYVGSRSSTLLKVKTFYDAEAEVTGYAPGKGQHKGVTGALQCTMASGKVRLHR